MSNPETVLQNEIRLACSSQRVRLFRNSVGRLRTSDGRWVQFGLAVGSADLVGLIDGGRFVSLEVKTPRGRQSPDQVAWGEMVRRFGGLHAVVRSPEEAVAALEAARDAKVIANAASIAGEGTR